MKLFEYQSRELLINYGIPVPKGLTASDADMAFDITAAFGGKSVIKAQVLSGGRGKAGGIKLVSSPGEAFAAAKEILAMKINAMPVNKILVSEAVDIQKEFYVSFAVNRDAKMAECLFSLSGGIDIEDTAASSPEKIKHIPVIPFRGIDETLLQREIRSSFIDEARDQAISIIQKMYRLFSEKDCLLVEINPLVFTKQNQLVALDAKIVIDDNSLIKHSELERLRNPEEYSTDETDAAAAGLSFVGLDGDIGCIVNGAGLAMATMDLIKHFGGLPANFLDVGGSSNPRKVVDALTILLRNKKIKAILMNIFGGITRCDDIANGVIIARGKIDIPVPFIIRLIGTNDVQGKEILLQNGFHAFTDLTEAVKAVIKASEP